MGHFGGDPEIVRKDVKAKRGTASGRTNASIKPGARKINNETLPTVDKPKTSDAPKVVTTPKEPVEDYMTHVKEQSVSTSKFYPPFPPGSEDSIQTLKGFALFRKQIEQLAMSPDNLDSARIQEAVAESKSVSVKDALANQKVKGLTLDHSQFTGLY